MPARAAPDFVALQQDREPELQDLGVGQARVGHVGLHHGRSGIAVAGTAAPRDGLVVLVAGVAEGEVVHGGLAARHHAQGAEQCVGDAGGGFHIAGHHRSRRVRVEHAAGRDDHLQRLQAAGIERDVVIDQGAERIQHRRHADRGGRVEVVGLLRAGAGEVDGGPALRGIDPHSHPDLRAVVQRQGELAVLQAGDDAAHRFFGVVLHMAHVGLHHVQTELRHHAAQLLHALLVGGDLGPEVGHVLLRVAAGVFAALQQRQHLGLAQHAAFDQLDVVDLHALFLDAGRERRHRPRRGAADVGMVAARADVKGGLGTLADIHRRDHRDVGQVGAAVVRVVEHIHIAGLHAAGVFADDRLDALAHGAQVHGHMGCVGDQVAPGIEQRTRKVEPLLDVHRVGGVLQLQAHLFGDVHEQVVEHLQQHRVDRGAGRVLRGARHAPLQHQVVQLGEAGLPARLHHGGGVLLGNDGRARNGIAGAQVFAHHQGGVQPLAVGVQAHRVAAGDFTGAVQRQPGLGRRIARDHRLHRHRLHDQALAGHEEGEALAVGRLERRLDIGHAAERHDQRRVAALVAQVDPAVHLQLAVADLLLLQFVAGGLGQRIELRGHRCHGVGLQHPLDRLLADHVLVGQAHAVGAEHTGQRMHEHPAHAQGVGHQASVLAAGATEALQGVAGDVVTARHRDLLDRIGHLLHRDADEALGHRLGRAAGLARQRVELRSHRLGAQGFVGLGAEHAGEIRRLDLAEHDVRIGHGQRAAAPVTGRAGVGAGALRADAEARSVEAQDGAAAGRHGVDAHHRRAHAHAGHLGLELALEGAGVVGHIGRGAAHVEADHLPVASQGRGAGHADDAAGRAGQDGVLALEVVGVGQAAAGLHEEQRHTRHLGRHLVDIAPQDGREVGVDHGGVAPAHELHHGAGLVRGADLGEAGLPGQPGRCLFMRRMPVTVHEHDGHAAQAGIEGRPQPLAQVGFVQRLQHAAVGSQTFLGFDDPAVEQLGQHDLAVEQAGPVLVGDAQRIAEAAGGHQQRGLALALQQRIGGHGGAHLHAGHLRRRHRLIGPQAQQMADAGHRRVAVLLRVLGQQLVGGQAAVGAAGHDVGEGAAPVDPELPAVVGCRVHGLRVMRRSVPPGRTCRRAPATGARVRRCRG